MKVDPLRFMRPIRLTHVILLLACVAAIGCSPARPKERLAPGCYRVRPQDSINPQLANRLPLSFQLADSGRLNGGADSVGAAAFWKGHQFTRRCGHVDASTTEVVASTGFTWTEMTLSASGDSVFGIAAFFSDAHGLPIPRVRVVGQRISCVEGQKSKVQLEFPAGTPIEELANAFTRGRAPKPDELIGVWKAGRHVITEKFMTGRAGPDRVFRSGETLSFRLTAGDRLEVLYSNVRSWGVASRNSAGDIVFLSDGSADVALFLSCRTVGANRLVCFDLDHVGPGVGDAIEFEKQ